jgi:DNA-nicking Smr family endonuclease
MSRRTSDRQGTLSDEDRRLWNRIRETVKPLPGRSIQPPRLKDVLARDEPHPVPQESAAGKAQGGGTRLPPYIPPVSVAGEGNKPSLRLDEPTARKLQKGKLKIDARIDLHGMTQDQAHMSLTRFIDEARDADRRIVLVITGKGRGGGGVLRRLVPEWLAEGRLRPAVSGWREANFVHGGEGALYVRIKRRPGRAVGGK